MGCVNLTDMIPYPSFPGLIPAGVYGGVGGVFDGQIRILG
jgi:hypothetical protein